MVALTVLATLENFSDFALVREATRVGLAVDQVPFYENVEDAAAAAVQLYLRVEALDELCFQPGSVGEVVSGAAVLDSDVHGFLVATDIGPSMPQSVIQYREKGSGGGVPILVPSWPGP